MAPLPPPPPPPPPPPAYTTIPISASDAISRSVHNLTSTIAGQRSWPDFFSSGGFDRPDSLSSAIARARANLRCFGVNYALIVGACGALSLIGSPSTLVVVLAILALWLLFHFFREDPLLLGGFHVSDRLVLACLVLASLWALWFTGCAWSLALGIGAGALLCAAHALCRNPDGMFLDEDEAVSRGLVVPDREIS